MKKLIFFVIIVTLITSCKDKAIVFNDPIPEHDTLGISSQFTKDDRVINIWTPPNYKNSTDSLPVLYMPDGGTKEDFPHIANTLDTLIKSNKIPPYILVGIENTVRRRDLSGPSEIEYDLQFITEPGGSDDFRAFIKKELMPEINKRYRTDGRRAIIGESLAGLFVIETFLLDNDLFDHYIAMDPSLWYNEQYLVKNFMALSNDSYPENTTLWFAGSSVEDISTHTRELDRILNAAGKEINWKYSDEPEEQHNTIFRATKEKALIWSLNDK